MDYPLYALRICVVEKQRLISIKRSDGSHIIRRKRKIKNVEILLHPLDFNAFWNDDDASLN